MYFYHISCLFIIDFSAYQHICVQVSAKVGNKLAIKVNYWRKANSKHNLLNLQQKYTYIYIYICCLMLFKRFFKKTSIFNYNHFNHINWYFAPSYSRKQLGFDNILQYLQIFNYQIEFTNICLILPNGIYNYLEFSNIC